MVENTISPTAKITDAHFIEGHWKGEAFGGKTEEIWTAAEGNSMLFTFRLVIDGKVNFYEIGHIIEDGESLLLQLKHFNSDLKGWEEKDETEDFKLLKKEKNILYFDGITYQKINENEMNAYVLSENKDGTTEELKFNFKRQ
tara:strand:- start:165567 stop:165992 length:426 start_codon:yes stop_codon:yes gene_type:complete